jgi:hypothetical protein
MKEYIFENVLHSNIEIKIKADHYTEAMELLLTVTRYIEDYKLQEQNERH